MASVVIRALIFRRAMTNPFTRPLRTPSIRPANTPIHRLSVMLMTTAVVTPAQAITDATERSKSPEARQNSIPQATMPDIEIASPSPFILMKLAKFGTKIAQPINRTANTTSIPY
ncbi:hypothetical protein D3C76_1211570 [compost metagenome]